MPLRITLAPAAHFPPRRLRPFASLAPHVPALRRRHTFHPSDTAFAYGLLIGAALACAIIVGLAFLLR